MLKNKARRRYRYFFYVKSFVTRDFLGMRFWFDRIFFIAIIFSMPEKLSAKGMLEQGGKTIQDIYQFHEEKNPWNFYRNHVDLIVATVGWRINRYFLIPYTGIQAYQEGISNHKAIIATIGSLEVICFVLFVTYFSPMKKMELLNLFSPKKSYKTVLMVGSWYAKGTVLRYPYFYKLAKIFPENCPKTYLFMMKTSFLVQNTLRVIF